MAGTVYYKMDDGTKIPLNPIPQASSVVTSTTNFGGILSGTDSTVQLALDTIDDHNHDSIYLNVARTDAYTPTANYHPATKKYVDDEISGIDLTPYLKKDGTVALTADWDAGSWQIRAETFESDVATGTAPLVIASTTLVSNLNADLLDGQEGSYYLDLTNATNQSAIDHGTISGLGDDDHTIYLLADGSRALGGNWNIGTYSLGDGTGTLVFSGAGDLALNGGSFDIDAGKYYQVGGLDILTATSDTVLIGDGAGSGIGGGASGDVSNNVCIQGGYRAGLNATGNVNYNCIVGTDSTGEYAGQGSSGFYRNLFAGHAAGASLGRNTSGQLVYYNIAIGDSAGQYAGYLSTGGPVYGNFFLGRQAGFSCSWGSTIGNTANNLIFGTSAGYFLSKNNSYAPYSNIIIGSYAFRNAGESGSSYVRQNVVIGEYAGAYWSATSEAMGNILIGTNAGYAGNGRYQLVISSIGGTPYATNLANAIICGVMSATTSDQELFLHATTQIGVGGSNYTQIDNNGYQTMAGTARVWTWDKMDAEGLQAPGTKPATLVEIGIGQAWEFTDGTDDTIEARFTLSAGMDRSIAPVLKLGWSTPTAAAGNCRWQVEYLYRAAGEDMSAAADATLVDNYACDASTANGLVSTAITLGTPGASDANLTLRIKRRADEAGDTLGEDNHLYGMRLDYVINALGTQYT